MTNTVVHVLHAGLPLCGFTGAVPANWPAGHLWVVIEQVHDANCAGCKHAAEELMVSRKH